MQIVLSSKETFWITGRIRVILKQSSQMVVLIRIKPQKRVMSCVCKGENNVSVNYSRSRFTTSLINRND